MKKFKLFAAFTLLILVSSVYSQTAIGKTSVSAGAILDFGTTNMGIVLPRVISAASVSSPTPGTFIFDTSDDKVKYFNGAWIDLSINSGPNIAASTLADSGNGAIIGATSSSASGVLVLESTTMALVLPNVTNPQINILSPEAGTMVYDTASNKVCFYNGNQWSFWGE